MENRCPLCASTRTAPFSPLGEGDGRSGEGYRVYGCGDCGVAFTWPRLDTAETSDLYGDDYYSFRSTSLESLPLWGSAATALDRALRLLRGRRSRLADLLERLLFWPARNVPQAVPLFYPGRDVLDLGCGAGDQMALWRRVGRNVRGVDISPRAAAEGGKRGLDIFTGEIWEAGFAAGSFDIVYANQVIEHTGDTHATLREIWRVLRPGGVLIVGVPNTANRFLAVFKSGWAFLQIPFHFLHFDPASLCAALARDGFFIRKVYTITPAAGLLESLARMFPGFGRVYADCHLKAPCIAAYVLLSLLLLPCNLGLRGDLLYVIAVKGGQSPCPGPR
ncbi:MAG: class I SAM-dependent methyltransferase [Actinomycetota bacterium]